MSEKINFTLNMKTIAPLNSLKAVQTIHKALENGEPSLYWDGRKITEPFTPTGRPRPIAASLSVSAPDEALNLGPVLTWSDPNRTIRFPLSKTSSSDVIVFFFFALLATALNETSSLRYLQTSNDTGMLLYKNVQLADFESMPCMKLMGPTLDLVSTLSKTEDAQEQRDDKVETLCLSTRLWTEKYGLISVLEGYNALIDTAAYRQVEQDFFDLGKQTTEPGQGAENRETILADAGEALLDLLVFALQKALNDDEDFLPLFEAFVDGDPDRIPALLRENAEHYEELMANPFRHLEWSYVEWLYNQILTALSPDYVQNYAESAGSLDLSFDPDHPETEALRLRCVQNVLHFMIRYNPPLTEEISALVMQPVFQLYPEEVVYSLENLLLIFAPLGETALLSDEDTQYLDQLKNEPGYSDFLTNLCARLISSLEDCTSYDRLDLPVLYYAVCALYKVCPPDQRERVMELCKDIFRKTSSVLVPERHPNQTLLHAFYNFALMIGYALEMADDLQEFADLRTGISKIMLSLAENEQILSLEGMDCLCLFLVNSSWKPSQIPHVVFTIFHTLNLYPTLHTALALHTVETLLDEYTLNTRDTDFDPVFRLYLALRESFTYMDNESIFAYFDSYLHDAQRATEEGAPLVASELYDLLIAFIDDYNKELFEQQHPDKASEYNPAIGLEMKRIELLSSAAFNFQQVSPVEVPRLILNILSILNQWNPQTEQELGFATEACCSVSRLLGSYAAYPASLYMAKQACERAEDHIQKFGLSSTMQKIREEAWYLRLTDAILCKDKTAAKQASETLMELLEEESSTRLDPDSVIFQLPEVQRGLLFNASPSSMYAEYLSIISLLDHAYHGDNMYPDNAASLAKAFITTLNGLIEAEDYDGIEDICDATTSMNTFSDSDAYMSMVTLAARSAFAAALKEDSPLRMSEMIGRELSRLAAFEENSDVVSENPGLFREALFSIAALRYTTAKGSYAAPVPEAYAACNNELMIAQLLWDSATEVLAIFLRIWTVSDPDWTNLQEKVLLDEELAPYAEDILELSYRIGSLIPGLSVITRSDSDSIRQALQLAALVEQRCSVSLLRMRVCLQLSIALQEAAAKRDKTAEYLNVEYLNKVLRTLASTVGEWPEMKKDPELETMVSTVLIYIQAGYLANRISKPLPALLEEIKPYMNSSYPEAARLAKKTGLLLRILMISSSDSRLSLNQIQQHLKKVDKLIKDLKTLDPYEDQILFLDLFVYACLFTTKRLRISYGKLKNPADSIIRQMEEDLLTLRPIETPGI